jgi:hypothetical protein
VSQTDRPVKLRYIRCIFAVRVLSCPVLSCILAVSTSTSTSSTVVFAPATRSVLSPSTILTREDLHWGLVSVSRRGTEYLLVYGTYRISLSISIIIIIRNEWVCISGRYRYALSYIFKPASSPWSRFLGGIGTPNFSLVARRERGRESKQTRRLCLLLSCDTLSQ